MIASSFSEAQKLYNLSVDLSLSWISKFYPRLNKTFYGVSIERVQAFSQHFFFTCQIEGKTDFDIWNQYPSTSDSVPYASFSFYSKFWIRLYSIFLSLLKPKEILDIGQRYQIVIVANGRHLVDQVRVVESLGSKFKILIVGKIPADVQKRLTLSKISFINITSGQRYLSRKERILNISSFVLNSLKKQGGNKFLDTDQWRKRVWYLCFEQFPEITGLIKIAKDVYEKSKPSLILTTSSNDVFGASFCAMAQQLGIAVAELQHGYINRGIDPRFYNADYQLVWGEIPKTIYGVRSTKAEIVGNPTFERSKMKKNRYPRPKGRGSPIFAQDSLHPRDEFRGFFARNKFKIRGGPKVLVLLAPQFGTVSLLKSHEDSELMSRLVTGLGQLPQDFEVVLRSHPSYDPKSALRHLNVPANISINKADNIDELIKESDIVITQPTTAGFMAVLYNKPLIFINNSWVTDKLGDPIKNSGGAVNVTFGNLDNIVEPILELLSNEFELKKQKSAQDKLATQYCSFFGDESVAQICKFAIKIIDSAQSSKNL